MDNGSTLAIHPEQPDMDDDPNEWCERYKYVSDDKTINVYENPGKVSPGDETEAASQGKTFHHSSL